MSQSFIVWADGTHSRDRHLSPVHAGHVIDALCKEGMGGEGKVFPVASFITTDSVKYVKQDCLGYWWVFTSQPVKGAEYAAIGAAEDEYCHKSATGWWTNKLFNLEK